MHVLQPTSKLSSPPSKIPLTPLFIDTASCGKVVNYPREFRVQQLELYTRSTELKISLSLLIWARKHERAGQILHGQEDFQIQVGSSKGG